MTAKKRSYEARNEHTTQVESTRNSPIVGDVTPGYPRGGPKCTRPDRVGRADGISADSIRTVRRARLQEASSGVGIRPDLPCTARDIVVTD